MHYSLFSSAAKHILQKKIIVIIQSGQSNSDGRAESPELSKEILQSAAKVLFYHGNASGNSHPSCTANELISLVPGSGSLQKGKNHFGPEMSFAAAIQEHYPKHKFAIIKYAKGGSSLFTDWDLEKGPHLQKLRDCVSNGLKELKEAGYEPEIRAFIWHQGESDSTKERAPQYAEKLATFLKKMRHDFDSTMAIAVGQISSKQKLKMDYGPLLIQAQKKVANQLQKTLTFATTDLSLKKDQLHFDTDGQVALGRKYAKALIPHLKERQTIQLWPVGKVPGNWQQEKEEVNIRRGGVNRIQYVQTPILTFYPAKEKNKATIVVCPGGGYQKQAYDKEGEEVAEWLNSQGYNAFILKYRLPLKTDIRHMPPLQDAQRAIAVIRAHSSQWGLGPKVGLMGFSAGGHLTVMASTTREKTYKAVDAIDQQPHLPDFSIPIYPAYLSENGQLTDIIKVSPQTPPTFIAHAEDDRGHYKNSPIYAKALKEQKVSINFKSYKTGGHGHGLRINGKDADIWPQDLAKWLREIIK